MQLEFPARSAGAAALLMVMAACASSPSVTKTFHDPAYEGRRFGNVLVIGIADDYDARAMFERELVARIRATGTSATAYYTVIGRNPPVTRSDVANAVGERGFDAVLLTRVAAADSDVRLRSGSADTKATTKGGGVLNLFRYDYAELNEPAVVDLESSVQLTTDLYAADEEEVVWSIDTRSSGHATIAELVEAQTTAIARALSRDGLVGD